MNCFKRISTALTIIAFVATLLPLQVFAASTGISVTPTTLATTVNTKVNFEVIVEHSVSYTPGTYVAVTDGGGGGSFFASSGSCNSNIADADNQFLIFTGENICYSNSTLGVYTILVQLLDGLGGNPIGATQSLTITVRDVEVNPRVKICHATQVDENPCQPDTVDAESIINLLNGHDSHNSGGLDDKGDIIPPFVYNFGDGEMTYPGKNWDTVYSNGLTGEQIYNDGKCDGRPSDQSADLAITKTVSTTTPVVGSTITYTLTVTNNGPDTAHGVIVSDLLPSSLTYVSASVNPNSTNPLTWQVGSLTSGANWSVLVTVTVESDVGSTTISNTATVIGSIFDPNLENNTDTVDVTTIVLPNGILGCTDLDAENYSAQATIDNGSCLFPLTVNKVLSGTTTATFNQFSFTVNGTSSTSFNASGTAVVLVPNGNHFIAEVATPGFAISYNNCAPAVISGASSTCTITNTVVTETPLVCTVGENLLVNGSFEEPVVTGDWEIFGAVTGWTIELSGGLELWRNFMGGASLGEQNAELDSASSTRVTQAVTTVPGATYQLRFDFSPRPGTGLIDNVIDALVDGSTLMTATGDGTALAATEWTTQSANFVASTTATTIGFEDKGTGVVGSGSLMDNAVLCLVSNPESSGGSSGGSGGSSGGRSGGSSTRPRSQVLGSAGSAMPLTASEQVSVLPMGAPSTGRGGTSHQTQGESLPWLFVSARRSQLVR